jgi:release factor glutamine methyltransferase
MRGTVEKETVEYSEEIPIQYREGKASFMGMDVLVDPRVLIPRPETELLVSVVARLCREKGWKAPLILDVGTGSGAVSMGLVKLMSSSLVIASDISGEALCVAKENIENLGYEKNITLVKSDMFRRFREGYHETFDIIVSNPPYVSENDYEKLDAWVKAEPRIALHAGAEGMDCLNILAEESSDYLKKGGFLAVEVGYDQAGKMKGKLASAGFVDIASFKDAGSHERVIIGRKNG